LPAPLCCRRPLWPFVILLHELVVLVRGLETVMGGKGQTCNTACVGLSNLWLTEHSICHLCCYKAMQTWCDNETHWSHDSKRHVCKESRLHVASLQMETPSRSGASKKCIAAKLCNFARRPLQHKAASRYIAVHSSPRHAHAHGILAELMSCPVHKTHSPHSTAATRHRRLSATA